MTFKQFPTTEGRTQPRAEQRQNPTDGRAAHADYPTVEAVAMAMQCSTSTIWRLARRGTLRRRRVLGRSVFDWSQVEKLMQARSREPKITDQIAAKDHKKENVK